MNDRTAVDRSAASRFLARARASGVELVEGVLARCSNLEGITREEVAARLGCDLDGLDRIAMCALPRPDHFDEDAAAIALRGGADATALSDMLRANRVADQALLAAEPPAPYRPGPRLPEEG